ncbi:SRPBCC domain-containing protein [Streptomyces sp. NPDC015127]|uniref:SRPBCC family protein n=1 Tax=Streptomyces sp. NPDC015127 TaxID=3364939 RepID=UPI0036FEE4F6
MAPVHGVRRDPLDRERDQALDRLVVEFAAPGGAYRTHVAGDNHASGRFVEIDPPRRVVFTWGWEGGAPVPPGSSTVEITLEPDGPDGERTLLRLVHRGLPPEACAPHRDGWHHYLDRLVVRAEGGDPGPDPWSTAAPE